MHTVEEAKTKWCPMVRFTVFPASLTATNRADIVQGGDKETRCCADQCMWWVWTHWTNMCLDSKEPSEPVRGRCGMVKA